MDDDQSRLYAKYFKRRGKKGSKEDSMRELSSIISSQYDSNRAKQDDRSIVKSLERQKKKQ